MTISPFLVLGGHRFVALTTFRESGEGVTTPVWIAREGDELLVTAPSASGKVTRVRHQPRVALRPSGRFGRIPTGSMPVEGRATIVDDPAEVARIGAIFEGKYGLEYRLFLGVERRAAGGRPVERVILRIAGA